MGGIAASSLAASASRRHEAHARPAWRTPATDTMRTCDARRRVMRRKTSARAASPPPSSFATTATWVAFTNACAENGARACGICAVAYGCGWTGEHDGDGAAEAGRCASPRPRTTHRRLQPRWLTSTEVARRAPPCGGFESGDAAGRGGGRDALREATRGGHPARTCSPGLWREGFRDLLSESDETSFRETFSSPHSAPRGPHPPTPWFIVICRRRSPASPSLGSGPGLPSTPTPVAPPRGHPAASRARSSALDLPSPSARRATAPRTRARRRIRRARLQPRVRGHLHAQKSVISEPPGTDARPLSERIGIGVHHVAVIVESCGASVLDSWASP